MKHCRLDNATLQGTRGLLGRRERALQETGETLEVMEPETVELRMGPPLMGTPGGLVPVSL